MLHWSIDNGTKGGLKMVEILIVEDEKPISNLIRMSLSKAGYACTCAYDGLEAANILNENHFDLVLLDIMLPGIDGLELLDYIRPMGIPVIFITAMGSTGDKVKGLRAGADDYLVKPFEVVELLARIDVVLRRYSKNDYVFRFGDLEINTFAMVVTRNGKEITLTKTEYNILVLFARNPGRALYRETIYEQVWGEPYKYGSKTVDIQVQRLRRKVGWENVLRSVSKVGYILELPNEDQV